MIVWILGAPGVGKTTLVRQLLAGDTYLVQKPKWTVADDVCAAGHYVGGTFDGADTVPYNGVEAALAFWKQELANKRDTIFDGDRFSHAKVKTYFEDLGEEVSAIHLATTPTQLEERRKKRGSNQNASWMKGRETKAKRFFESFDPKARFELEGVVSPEFTFKAVSKWLNS